MDHVSGRATVAVVGGAGAVGSTTAFALLDSDLVGEIVLVDIDDERAAGQVADLAHAAPFGFPTRVYTGSYEDCWDADVVVITAGASQEPGETRLELLERNAEIFAEMIPEITDGMDDGVLLVVTNPVDVLSYVAWSVSELPARRVIGSGTVLDTARFRHALARRFDLAPESVQAYVVGEHGDSAVPVWSATTLGGVAFERYAAQAGIDDVVGLRSRIGDEIRDAAYEIIERKGRTKYGVARAVASTVERIIGDDHAVVPVSTLVSGHHGIDDEVYLSVPCLLDRSGVRDVVELDLSAAERAALADSAGVVADSIDRLPVE